MESSAKSADHESIPKTTFRDPISQKLFRNSAQAGSEINSSASFYTAIFLVNSQYRAFFSCCELIFKFCRFFFFGNQVVQILSLISLFFCSHPGTWGSWTQKLIQTRPIEQSIAHLLFHRPSDISLWPDEDVLTYKSHLMVTLQKKNLFLLTHSHSDIQSVSHSASFSHHNRHRFLSPTVVEPEDRARKGNSRAYNRSRSCGK